MCFSVSPSLLTPSSVFSISVIVFFSLTGSFLYFLVSYKILTVILFPNSVGILITNALNSLSGKLFVSLGFISGVFSCSFV